MPKQQNINCHKGLKADFIKSIRDITSLIHFLISICLYPGEGSGVTSVTWTSNPPPFPPDPLQLQVPPPRTP